MAPPDTNPKSLFPPAAIPAHPALPRTGGSFGVPRNVEFPMFTDPEDAAMTAFGSKVEADMDPDLFDARVTHVRDARYGFGSPQPDVLRVVPVTGPVTHTPLTHTPLTHTPLTHTPLTHSREHAWRIPALVFLAVFAVSVLAGFAGAFFLTR
jgi:hypothetical protein